MTFEEQYEAFCEMFNTPGWKMLTENFTADLRNLNNLIEIADPNDFIFRKGQASVLSQILSLETALHANWEQMNNNEDS